jgi:hypothetical protein
VLASGARRGADGHCLSYDARRLANGGYEILHIETHYRETGDESWIVWTRAARPDDIPESELPY